LSDLLLKATPFPPQVAAVIAVLFFTLLSCSSKETEFEREMREFAVEYANAWNSHNPVRVANYFAKNGSLQVNDFPPISGRREITAESRVFMTALPDLEITMKEFSLEGDHFMIHWTLRGTYSVPGGGEDTGWVHVEDSWTLSDGGLLLKSAVHMDDDVFEDYAEYQRQGL
jgi:uncharacterized protein (TIGR02246 family)